MVMTSDFDSENRGSNPCRTLILESNDSKQTIVKLKFRRKNIGMIGTMTTLSPMIIKDINIALDQLGVSPDMRDKFWASGGMKKYMGNNRPKRSRTAWNAFCADPEMRDLVKKDNPDLSPKDVMRELGRLWKQTEDRSKWAKLAEEDKKRYNEEMASYSESESDSESPRRRVKRVKRKRIQIDQRDPERLIMPFVRIRRCESEQNKINQILLLRM